MHRVHERLGPAGLVTLVRAVLSVVVAVLVAISYAGPAYVAALVTISTVALVLDAVDGRVARRTHTESAFGARFDMETDAFLILVLSVYAVAATGWWVLLIGAARYLLWLAERVAPWLRRPVPPRYWRKVVAAIQGIVLTVAASGLLPHVVTTLALAAALALLAESFGRDVWWQWRSRRQDVPYPRAHALTLGAGVLLWLALVVPDDPDRAGLSTFARIPLELLVLVAVALLLGRRSRIVIATVFGVLLAALVVVKVLDLGFEAVFDRPFDPISDWSFLGPGVGVLGDSIGGPAADIVTVAVVLLVAVLLVLLPLAAVRLTRAAAGHRGEAARAAGLLGLAWALCAIAGLQFGAVGELASSGTAALAYDETVQVRADIADRRTFAREVTADPYADAPADQLLTGLRGKDVILAFVESYGRVAVQGTDYSPGVDAVLDAGTRQLARAGFHARSAFLTSPTFGAGSWLAHSTLQSGLWVDSEQRYNQLLGDDRLTLSSAFHEAGWRTVSDVPADTEDWPQGADFYGYDQMYDSRDVGYQGPAFSYATMPDQYTLDHFRRTELAPQHRRPVMAEIDLVSSHHPWTPLPHLVPWDTVGDGSVFDPMPAQGPSPETVFRDPDAVRRAYGQSIEYSLSSLVSFVTTYPDPDLVLVVLGDHQPHSYVSGSDPGHDVPISVIAHDPLVLQRIAPWGWQRGLHPAPDAPVWPMDAFRDRFLQAYGPTG